MDRLKVLSILNFYEEFDVIPKRDLGKIADEIISLAKNDRKSVTACDLFAVDFDNETIEIRMPNEVKNKRFFSGTIYVNFDMCTVSKGSNSKNRIG